MQAEIPTTSWIKETLEQAFSAHEGTSFQIQDDSKAHEGHAPTGGAGHYTLFITSEAFQGLSRVQRHRLVYSALSTGIGPRIHALSIRAMTPEEATHASNQRLY